MLSVTSSTTYESSLFLFFCLSLSLLRLHLSSAALDEQAADLVTCAVSSFPPIFLSPSFRVCFKSLARSLGRSLSPPLACLPFPSYLLYPLLSFLRAHHLASPLFHLSLISLLYLSFVAFRLSFVSLSPFSLTSLTSLSPLSCLSFTSFSLSHSHHVFPPPSSHHSPSLVNVCQL